MGRNGCASTAAGVLSLSMNIWCFAPNAGQGSQNPTRSEFVKRTLLLLLTTAILAGLCACGESTDTDVTNPIDRPTIQDQPEATNPAVIVDPAGVYRLTGLSTEGPDAYQEMDFGELCVYEDNSGDIYFDDYYHDFTWAMEGNQFIATTTDDPSVTIQGR